MTLTHWIFHTTRNVSDKISSCNQNTHISYSTTFPRKSCRLWCDMKNTVQPDRPPRSQRPRGLGNRSSATRLMRLWVRIPAGAWIFVCCECRVLSGRGLCDELITRPEESCRMWCVVVCDLETSWVRKLWPTGGCLAKDKQTDRPHMKIRRLRFACWIAKATDTRPKYVTIFSVPLQQWLH